jgi:flagellar assembly factor FliW
MAISETKYWGKLDYSEDAILEFPLGIPGFEHERRFVLIEQRPLDPLVFLQSLTNPNLCFITLHVRVVCPDYKLQLSAEDSEVLGLPAGRRPAIGPQLACLAIVHIDESEVTANLLAPIVIHVPARRAVQAILAGSDYSHQFRIDTIEAPVCS